MRFGVTDCVVKVQEQQVRRNDYRTLQGGTSDARLPQVK
jgi:hypothetical protein